MKMLPEDFVELKKEIDEVLKNRPTMREDYKKEGLSAMRFRWDCVYLIPKAVRTPWFDRIYTYLNDEHVDTALRQIVEKSNGE